MQVSVGAALCWGLILVPLHVRQHTGVFQSERRQNVNTKAQVNTYSYLCCGARQRAMAAIVAVPARAHLQMSEKLT